MSSRNFSSYSATLDPMVTRSITPRKLPLGLIGSCRTVGVDPIKMMV